MRRRVALITGANGAIGQGLCRGFQEDGYYVIGSDIHDKGNRYMDAYISIDLERFCNDDFYKDQSINSILQKCHPGLDVLINNAAVQILNSVQELTYRDWKRSMDINLNSAFSLIRSLLPELEKSKGCVINIASIHSEQTKPYFSAYATSKAGLIGLTKSLSVELGRLVRFNAISPAAISTPMLEAGFATNVKTRKELDSYHPSGEIGTVNDVVEASLYLSKSGNFINGAIINIDGGIRSRLHDPE